MALSGVHISCVTVSSRGSASLVSKINWSQTMDNEGVTSLGAMPDGSSFEIYPAADVFVAVGPNPDASEAGAGRLFCPAGITRNVYCAPGDRVAWVLA